MNYNTLTYGLYFGITLFTVLYVGSTLFKSGCPFLIEIFGGNKAIADAVNKVLISGYYLVNIGYIVITLKVWDNIGSLQQMIGLLGFKIGLISITLGVMHISNFIILMGISKIVKKKQLFNQ
ncbi:MAG: hypothetical protein V4608_03600 [Bacteroidota bacterium]